MFDRQKTRAWIAVVWIAVFAGFWALLQFLFLPNRAMAGTIDALQESVVKNDWAESSENLDKLEQMWKQSKLAIQINNGTAEVSSFEHRLGQIRVLVNNQEDDALGPIGELKQIANSITTTFPGP